MEFRHANFFEPHFQGKKIKCKWEKTPQKVEADKRKISPGRKESEPKKKRLSPEKGKTFRSINQATTEGRRGLDFGQRILEKNISKGAESPIQETSKGGAETLLWVDKYKPTSLKMIIGQQGDQSCANKLFRWLRNWYKNSSDDKHGNYIIHYSSDVGLLCFLSVSLWSLFSLQGLS